MLHCGQFKTSGRHSTAAGANISVLPMVIFSNAHHLNIYIRFCQRQLHITSIFAVNFSEIMQLCKCLKPRHTVWITLVTMWKFLLIRPLTFFSHVQCTMKGIHAFIPFMICVNICKVSNFHLAHFDLSKCNWMNDLKAFLLPMPYFQQFPFKIRSMFLPISTHYIEIYRLFRIRILIGMCVFHFFSSIESIYFWIFLFSFT